MRVESLVVAQDDTNSGAPSEAQRSSVVGRVYARLIAKGGNPQRVALIYSHGPLAAAVNFMTAASFVLMAWGDFPDWMLVTWFALITVKCLYFNFNGPEQAKKLKIKRISKRTLRLLSLASGAFGLLWMPVTFYIFSLPPEIRTGATALLWVLMLGATFVYASIPILAFWYMLVAMAPAAGWYLFAGTEDTALLAASILLLIAMLMLFAQKFSVITNETEEREKQNENAMRLLEQAHDENHRLAERDPTTGLRNRRSLTSLLEQKLRSAGEGDYGLFIIDLDHFKHINDAYGHDFGDKYLSQIGRLMENATEGRAQVARLGGDEFAIVTCEPLPREEIIKIGEAVLRKLGGMIAVDGVLVRVSGSIGVGLAPSLCSSVAEWLSFADHALRAAKAAERGTLRVFEPADRKQMHARNRLGLQLDRAIECNEIAPWYQPQLNINTGELMGFEALARWRSPSGIHVPPPQFFELAEGRGVVLDLSERIFGRVGQDMKCWREQGLDFGTMSVNLHPAQLHHNGRLQDVLTALIDAAGSADLITLEITENCIVGRGTEEIPIILQHLADRGCAISLDDFGTGYASLTHIRSLPIHEVKVDRKFIADLESSEADREIVRSILRIARLRDIHVVAEGIETGEQISLLRNEGCVKGQGFYFARPMPASDVPSYIRRLHEWRDEAAM